MADATEHGHQGEQGHHDHGDSARHGVGINEHGQPSDNDKEGRRNVSLDQVIVDLSLQKNSEDDAGEAALVVVGGVVALKDDGLDKLVEGDVGVDHVMLDPLELDQVGGVTGTLVFDFAQLLVDRVSVKVHVAGNVIVDTGRIPAAVDETYTMFFYENLDL